MVLPSYLRLNSSTNAGEQTDSTDVEFHNQTVVVFHLDRGSRTTYRFRFQTELGNRRLLRNLQNHFPREKRIRNRKEQSKSCRHCPIFALQCYVTDWNGRPNWSGGRLCFEFQSLKERLWKYVLFFYPCLFPLASLWL